MGVIEGTYITLTNYKKKKIEELERGEKLLSCKIEGLEPLSHSNTAMSWTKKDPTILKGESPVKYTSTNPVAIYRIINDKLAISLDHVIFTKDGETDECSWNNAKSLRRGDFIFNESYEFEEITALKKIKKDVSTIVLSLSGYPYYFANGYLIHNINQICESCSICYWYHNWQVQPMSAFLYNDTTQFNAVPPNCIKIKSAAHFPDLRAESTPLHAAIDSSVARSLNGNSNYIANAVADNTNINDNISPAKIYNSSSGAAAIPNFLPTKLLCYIDAWDDGGTSRLSSDGLDSWPNWGMETAGIAGAHHQPMWGKEVNSATPNHLGQDYWRVIPWNWWTAEVKIYGELGQQFKSTNKRLRTTSTYDGSGTQIGWLAGGGGRVTGEDGNAYFYRSKSKKGWVARTGLAEAKLDCEWTWAAPEISGAEGHANSRYLQWQGTGTYSHLMVIIISTSPTPETGGWGSWHALAEETDEEINGHKQRDGTNAGQKAIRIIYTVPSALFTTIYWKIRWLTHSGDNSGYIIGNSWMQFNV